jgi:hypothetical protein
MITSRDDSRQKRSGIVVDKNKRNSALQLQPKICRRQSSRINPRHGFAFMEATQKTLRAPFPTGIQFFHVDMLAIPLADTQIGEYLCVQLS